MLGQLQAAEMEFLRLVHGVTFRENSCEIHKNFTLNVANLSSECREILTSDQNAPRKIGGQLMLATPRKSDPEVDQRTGGMLNISDLVWSRLGCGTSRVIRGCWKA